MKVVSAYGMASAFAVLVAVACSSVPQYLTPVSNADASADDSGLGADANGASDGRVVFDAPPQGRYRIFVTSSAYQGDLFGQTGKSRVDALCTQAGQNVAQGSRWKALLWSKLEGAPFARIEQVPGGWYTVPGPDNSDVLVFPNRDAMKDSSPVPINISELGTPVGSPDRVWTGGGTALGQTCSDWNEVAGATGTYGDPNSKSNWMDEGDRSCDALGRLYCVQQP